MDFDAIVIGGGGAGAAVTWQLARNGLKVACLDEAMDTARQVSLNKTGLGVKAGPFSPMTADRNSPYDYPINDDRIRPSHCVISMLLAAVQFYILLAFHASGRLTSSFAVSRDWLMTSQFHIRRCGRIELNETQMNVSGLVSDPAYPDIKELLPPIPLGDCAGSGLSTDSTGIGGQATLRYPPYHA